MNDIQEKNNIVIPEHYRIIEIDYAKEVSAGRGSCIDLEHRFGICPHSHEHTAYEDIEGFNEPLKDERGFNTVLQTLKESLINQCVGLAADNLLVTRIATGTSAANSTQGMTTLGAEYYRDVPTDLKKITPTQFSVYWFFNTTVANSPSDLQEWGIVAVGGTAVANSGKLIARFLQPFNKTATKTVSGQYDFTVT